jgi:hypothetical protein
MEYPQMEDYLAARGGPFYNLQHRLKLLHKSALNAGWRALIAVAIAWGVPLLLAAISGHAFGEFQDRPFLLDLGVWARFVIAIAAFILVEPLVEVTLRRKLIQLKAVLAPSAIPDAAQAIASALKQRDSVIAEMICVLLAVIASGVTLWKWSLTDAAAPVWGVTVQGDTRTLMPAAWWCVLVSSPMLYFLFLRCLWRHLVWAMLLGKLARLDMQLAVSHPDKNGGLGFIGEYPNAYSLFVFGVSCILGAAIAYQINDLGFSLQTYGLVMAFWLAIVLIVFTSPLAVFYRPLATLKRSTLAQTGILATRFFRRSEDNTLGRTSAEASTDNQTDNLTDPTKLYDAAKKLSVVLLNRRAIVPVCAAALLPLVAGGATMFPFKEIWSVAKKLLLL